MELKEQLENSQKVLEWAGWVSITEFHPPWWRLPDGSVRCLLPNLYSKENLWILFEYVIPRLKAPNTKLTIEKPYGEWGWLVFWTRNTGEQAMGESSDISSALMEAILKSLEASGD